MEAAGYALRLRVKPLGVWLCKKQLENGGEGGGEVTPKGALGASSEPLGAQGTCSHELYE